MTKRSLATLSHTLEQTAAELGDGATVIGTFQYESYFLPRGRSFDRLRTSGVTTLVAYAGDHPSTQDGHVIVPRDHSLIDVWAAVLVSDSLCGYVYATDAQEFGDTSEGLESARLFDAEIGFDPHRAVEIAHELVSELSRAGLPSSLADQVNHRIGAASAQPERSAVERAWAAGMGLMTQRLEEVSQGWRDQLHKATTDPLTGLANREGLRQWTGMTGAAELPNPPVGVLMLDMNGFKAVNDTLGHDAGDAMLCEVAAAISRTVRTGDLVARWGGDEFVVLCPGLDDERELEALGERISAAVDGIEVGGISAAIDFGTQVSDRRPLAFAVADAAMYDAKRSRTPWPRRAGNQRVPVSADVTPT